jgi:Ca2+-binding RTX toxin-like protein
VQGDLLRGGAGDDLLVGDQATTVQLAASALGAPTTLRTNGDFVVEPVRATGSLVAQVTLTQPTVGGDDVLLGEDGNDVVHGGAGNDVVNGGAGEDVVYGALGTDAVWGGLGHDRVFGGPGDDALDLKVLAGDPVLWKAVAPVEDRDGLKATTNGRDLVNGGRGADRLQADEGDAGKTPGDRLLDWTGIHNLYSVCAGAYGAGKIQNKYDPATAALLTELARSTGSVGADEISEPGNGEETTPHPLAPGNFTCEG